MERAPYARKCVLLRVPVRQQKAPLRQKWVLLQRYVYTSIGIRFRLTQSGVQAHQESTQIPACHVPQDSPRSERNHCCRGIPVVAAHFVKLMESMRSPLPHRVRLEHAAQCGIPIKSVQPGPFSPQQGQFKGLGERLDQHVPYGSPNGTHRASKQLSA